MFFATLVKADRIALNFILIMCGGNHVIILVLVLFFVFVIVLNLVLVILILILIRPKGS